MSLSYVHIRTAQGIGNIFSNIISSGTNDVILSPVENALNDRKNLEGEYDFPFISVWPEPAQVNESQWRHKLSYKKFFTFQPDQDASGLTGTELQIFPVEITYNCEYWEEQNKRRLDFFNQEFVRNARTQNVFDLTLPFVDKDGNPISGLEGDEIDFKQKYEFSELTDNSDLEFDTKGVGFRWSFQVNIESYFFHSPDLNESVIEKIIIEYFDEENVASNLIESGTITG